MLAIQLPNGKWVSAGAYCKAWKEVKSAPQLSYGGWGHFGEPGTDILKDIRKGINARINAKIPGYGVGRKWSKDWEMRCWRGAWNLNRRIIVRFGELPKEVEKRVAHRLYSPDDF